LSKNRKFLLTLVAAIMLLSLVLFLSGLKNVRVQSAPVLLVNVSVESIEKVSQYQHDFNVAGKLEALMRASLSFEYGGQIVQWHVEEGDTVVKGQPLVGIDDRVYQTKLNELQAALSKAQSQLALANITLKRLEPLKSKDVASQQLFDESVMQRNLYQGLVEEAEARIETANIALQKTTLIAPFDGYIVKRMKDTGSYVSPGVPVVDFISNELRARVSVPKTNIASMNVGDKVRLVWRGLEQTGVIEALNPILRSATQTIDVLASLPSPHAMMRDGDEIQIHLENNVVKEGAWLPLGALTSGIRGTWRVFVVEPSSALVSIRAVNLEYQSNDRVFVTGGLKTGDSVVVQGAFKLSPGQKVNIIEVVDPSAVK
jgi:RND family efflux transporter MFP subunit